MEGLSWRVLRDAALRTLVDGDKVTEAAARNALAPVVALFRQRAAAEIDAIKQAAAAAFANDNR